MPQAARAALAPQAPWTPPPGWAEADARYRRLIGVSGRPEPATGRKMSCWCSPAVPPLSAPADEVAVEGLELDVGRAPAGRSPGPGSRGPGSRCAPPFARHHLEVGVVPDATDLAAYRHARQRRHPEHVVAHVCTPRSPLRPRALGKRPPRPSDRRAGRAGRAPDRRSPERRLRRELVQRVGDVHGPRSPVGAAGPWDGTGRGPSRP